MENVPTAREPKTRNWPAGSFAEKLLPVALTELLELGREIRHPAGSQLIREGQEADFVLFILAGQAKVVISDGHGNDLLLSVVGPGELIGEMACMEGVARSATVISLNPVHSRKIAASTFLEFVEKRPRMAIAVASLISKRLRNADQRRLMLTASQVTARLARMIRMISPLFANVGEPTKIPLSQNEWAQLINAAEVSVQRAFRELRNSKIINTEYRTLIVPCMPCLDRFTQPQEKNVQNPIMGCGGTDRHRSE
ncbi:Crp/Fnr family transcriptional regulator [Amycolatopsis vastitatis]|uniref:Cyclic nucleotide-binding domain-containing protein n=1 Tax=Amycolatopsis vastitatis TaxID=1905142 RepID=A0A229SYE3_9PSEU|nr:Crp/Fnr family transcriptional regulator [Amycolatopsis vastitatis]OXM63996.1 hypothetical protein CF165_26935 [Amycolatopsis vastitatis]